MVIRDCDVEGLEFSGLEHALTTEDHSFGCINDRVECGVPCCELEELWFCEKCALDDGTDGDGLKAVGLDA